MEDLSKPVETTETTVSSSSGGWYPCPPPENLPANASEMPPQQPAEDPKARLLRICNDELKIKYIDSNHWGSISREQRQLARRFQVKGVEARKLPPSHFLHGEYGLFATRKFSKFDIVGEYVGKIVGNTVNGHYVAALEDKEHEESLGIDAQHMGNEMRFINSYLNVAFRANVTMRTAYVDTLPHILLVCMEDIDVDDELLLDYGEAYNQAYLLPKKVVKVEGNLSTEELMSSLPMGGSSSDEDSDQEEAASK